LELKKKNSGVSGISGIILEFQKFWKFLSSFKILEIISLEFLGVSKIKKKKLTYRNFSQSQNRNSGISGIFNKI
jgi:hypothetical protein